jgi:hypothetical protein
LLGEAVVWKMVGIVQDTVVEEMEMAEERGSTEYFGPLAEKAGFQRSIV